MTWKLRLLLSSLLLLPACSPPPDPPPEEDAEILREVLDSYWSYLFEHEIWPRVKHGADVERLPDVTFAKARERSEVARRHLERLEQIRPEKLIHDDWVAFAVLSWDLGIEAERVEHYWVEFTVTPRVVRETYIPQVFQEVELREPKDLERYLRLLGQMKFYTEATHAKLRGQVERGILVPRAEIDLLLPIWRDFATPGKESPFYVARDRLTELAAAYPDEAAAFQAEMERTLRSGVEPALAELVDYLAGEYSEKAPETVGLGQYPGGAEYYRFLAKWFSTLELAPREIHEIGLARVAEIHAAMDEVRRSVGFEGTAAEFRHFLETDPRFYARAPEEIAAQLDSYVAKIEPRIDAWFSRRPEAPYRVRRLPAAYEGGVTYGYYRPPTERIPFGTYYFNGSDLAERPLYQNPSRIYHELVPGHHMQVALQYEARDRHLYFQNNYYSAHAEGWAVYASRLAEEAGMYEDPYDHYGHLSLDAVFATRLVVDTGLNALGWSRERAALYMRENTLESEAVIASETLRYAAGLPGHALGYQIGADKILELRERAKAKLGQRFDIRRFHDAILDYGPMPMTVLEAHIGWFIEEQSL